MTSKFTFEGIACLFVWSIVRPGLLLPGCLDGEIVLQEISNNVGALISRDLREAAVVEAEEIHVPLGQQFGEIVQPRPHRGVDVADFGGCLGGGPAGQQRVVVVEGVGHRDVVGCPEDAGRRLGELVRKFLLHPCHHAAAQRGCSVFQVPRGDPAEAVPEEFPVDSGSVFEAAALCVVIAQPDAGLRLDELGDSSWRKEHVGRDRPAEEHVVIGIQEVLREALDVVQLALDRLGVVRGQH